MTKSHIKPRHAGLLLALAAAIAWSGQASASSAQAPSVEELTAQLQASVALMPDDGTTTADSFMKPVISRVDRSNPEAQLNLGAALLRVKHFEASVSALQLAANLDPSNPRTHGLLGDAAYWSPDCALARPAYEMAIDLDPTSAEARRWHRQVGACSLEQKDFVAAEKACSIAVQLQPSDVRARLCLGAARFNRKDYLGALGEFKAVGATNADYTYRNRARAGEIASLASAGKTDEARTLTREVLKNMSSRGTFEDSEVDRYIAANIASTAAFNGRL